MVHTTHHNFYGVFLILCRVDASIYCTGKSCTNTSRARDMRDRVLLAAAQKMAFHLSVNSDDTEQIACHHRGCYCRRLLCFFAKWERLSRVCHNVSSHLIHACPADYLTKNVLLTPSARRRRTASLFDRSAITSIIVTNIVIALYVWMAFNEPPDPPKPAPTAVPRRAKRQ